MSHSPANAIAFSRGIVSSRIGASTFRSGASTANETSKRTWSLPLPVQPCATVDAPTSRATAITSSAMQGRARPDTIGYLPSYIPFARIAGTRYSAANRSTASATRTLAAPARCPRSTICAKSSCCPTSTATACPSKPRSASHRIVTDVSRPPLYARTAFSTIVRLHDVRQGGVDRRGADAFAPDDQDRVVARDRARDLGEPRSVDPFGQDVGRAGRRAHDEADVGPDERHGELLEQTAQARRRRRPGAGLRQHIPHAVGVVHAREPQLFQVPTDRRLGRLVPEVRQARADLF